MKHLLLVAVAVSLAGASARAQSATSPNAPPTAPAPPVASPAQPAPPSLQPAAQTPAPTQPPLSQSKFLGALYAEIARHIPEKSPAGAGEVTASLHVNAQGKVDKVVIEKSTSDALAKAVKKILAEVQAPPPPGGGFDVSQTFRFH